MQDQSLAYLNALIWALADAHETKRIVSLYYHIWSLSPIFLEASPHPNYELDTVRRTVCDVMRLSHFI
jgi:hypothetical protein